MGLKGTLGILGRKKPYRVTVGTSPVGPMVTGTIQPLRAMERLAFEMAGAEITTTLLFVCILNK